MSYLAFNIKRLVSGQLVEQEIPDSQHENMYNYTSQPVTLNFQDGGRLI